MVTRRPHRQHQSIALPGDVPVGMRIRIFLPVLLLALVLLVVAVGCGGGSY
jgi:hypothetical protein